MNGLDSPLEVLAFNLVNLTPLFNNLCAFLAVFTAAMFSFRHFRASAKPVVKTLHETVLQKVNDNVTTNVDVQEEKEEDEEEEVVLTRGNSKKFFTIYYDEEGENKEGCVDDDVYGGDEEEEGEKDESGVIIEKWTVEMRGGELGWYEFQDRSVINGSVVKLWEGEREKSNSPRKRGNNNKSCSLGVITPFGLLV